MLKNIVILDIMGGLGNQIFQLSLGIYLKNSGFNVIINPHWYSDEKNFTDGTTKRNLEINLELFEFKIIGKNTLFFLNFFNKFYINKALEKINFYKLHEGQNFNINEIAKINRLTGYWQNENALFENIPLIKKNILSFYTNLKDEELLENKIAVHIRKGDYEKIDETLPDTYYLRALNDIFQNNEFEYDIFTDQSEVDFNKDLYKNAKNIYYSDDESSIKDLIKMFNYSIYIISNSTFSLLAALMSNVPNPVVYFPSPWFKNLNHKPTIPNNWKSIEYLN